MASTSIEWTDHSINPLRARHKATGNVGHYCEKIAAGCKFCYSSAMQRRFGTPEFGGCVSLRSGRVCEHHLCADCKTPPYREEGGR